MRAPPTLCENWAEPWESVSAFHGKPFNLISSKVSTSKYITFSKKLLGQYYNKGAEIRFCKHISPTLVTVRRYIQLVFTIDPNHIIST